jgi:CRISPR-associated protein Cas2
MYQRISQYRLMWILVLFDLPTDTKEDRKIYADFRKKLLKDGFLMLQYSCYARHCSSIENTDAHIQRIRKWLPDEGHVAIMKITDKQFGMIEMYYGRAKAQRPSASQQLNMF